MRVEVMAVIVDHSIPQRKPRLVQCEVSHWGRASPAALAQYVTERRRAGRDVDLEQIELLGLTVRSSPPRRRK